MGARSEILGECRWADEGKYLGDIVRGEILPLVAKVSHGTYASLGQPSFSTPGLVSHVLLMSAGKTLSMVAQCVKFKGGRTRVIPFGPTLLIPNSFPGHFEILNEEGREVPNSHTAEALAKLLPQSCLVREPFKSYTAEIKEGTAEKVYRIGGKTRTVLPGEILTLVGEVTVPSGKGKIAKYLRCLDQDQRTVFLPCIPKGKFSALAFDDSIGGVHTTRGILQKRLPLMVRLVEGRPPTGRNFKFFPELRLYSTLQEQLLFALPLTPSWKESLIPLPLSAPLKFQIAKNMDELECSKSYMSLVAKATGLLNQVKDNIQIYDICLKKEMRFDGRQWKSYAPPIFLSSTSKIEDALGLENVEDGEKDKDANVTTEKKELQELEDYQDIDELYDFVRGIKPTPPHLMIGGGTSPNSNNNNNNESSNNANNNNNNKGKLHPKPTTTLVTITSSGPDVIAHINPPRPPQRHGPKHRFSLPEIVQHKDIPPVPPPIETIPTRKFLHQPPSNTTSPPPPPPPNVSISVLNTRNRDESLEGTQIQIQIRSNSASNKNESAVSKETHHQDIVITTTRGKILDSAGGSMSTTPTNTSGSAQSSSSSNKSGNHNAKKVLGRGLYAKHNGSSGSGDTGIGLSHYSDGLSGSPTNRLVFRRSPIFDCRYKSLTDLTADVLPPPSPYHNHPHPHHPLQHLHSSSGRLGSLTNLNFLANSSNNILFPKGPPPPPPPGRVVRPKSLTNILDDRREGQYSGCGSKPTGAVGVKKRLAELVSPFYQSNNVPYKSSSQRSGRHYYRKSSHAALFL